MENNELAFNVEEFACIVKKSKIKLRSDIDATKITERLTNVCFFCAYGTPHFQGITKPAQETELEKVISSIKRTQNDIKSLSDEAVMAIETSIRQMKTQNGTVDSTDVGDYTCDLGWKDDVLSVGGERLECIILNAQELLKSPYNPLDGQKEYLNLLAKIYFDITGKKPARRKTDKTPWFRFASVFFRMVSVKVPKFTTPSSNLIITAALRFDIGGESPKNY